MKLINLNSKIDNLLYIIFFNCYFFITYFFVFFFYFFETFKIQYNKHFITSFNFSAFLYLSILIFSVNILYFFFNEKLNLAKKNSKLLNSSYSFEILILFIFFYFSYDLIKNSHFTLSINHISNFIFLIFVTIILIKSKNIILLVSVSFIFLTIIAIYSTASFFSIYFLSFLMLLIFHKLNKFFYLPILFFLSILLIFSILFLNKNPKSQKSILLDYDTHILRLSNFHIINEIFNRTPECKIKQSNSIIQKYNNLVDSNYTDNDNFRNDTLELANLFKSDDQMLNMNIIDYSIFKKDLNFNVIAHFLKNTCISQAYLKGNSYKEFFDEKLNNKKEQINLNFYGNKFGKKYGLINVSDFRTGVGPTLFGDLFMNFGYYSVIIISILIISLFYILSLSNHYILNTLSFYIFANFLLSLESTAIELIFNVSRLFIFYLLILSYIYFRKKLF